jgi:hypothetical protein
MKSELSTERKLEIVFNLISKWKQSPLKTFSELLPGSNPPPQIKDLNLQQFLSAVFVDQKAKDPVLYNTTKQEWSDNVLKVCK